MGTLKYRDLDKIHNKNIKLCGSQGARVDTYWGASCVDNISSKRIRINNQAGCCTSLSTKLLSGTHTSEWLFIGLEKPYFPSTFRNPGLIKEWIDFINETFPFAEIKLLRIGDDKNIIDKPFWESQNISFVKLEDNKNYFAIKTNIIPGYTYSYSILFQLSLIRYFVSNEYYFMIYDCLRLRKLKSLSKLSNWEIMNIAKYGVQINKQQFKNIGCSSIQFAFLRDYRSPIFNSYVARNYRSIEDVTSLLNNGKSQNLSVSNSYLLIDNIYLMSLFQSRQYLKLFKLINNPKYIVDYNEHPKRINNFTEQTLKYLSIFQSLNNRNINIKEYEKTL